MRYNQMKRNAAKRNELLRRRSGGRGAALAVAAAALHAVAIAEIVSVSGEGGNEWRGEASQWPQQVWRSGRADPSRKLSIMADKGFVC